MNAESIEADQTGMPWRVGRKVSRTIYAIVSTEPSDDDVLIGLMDTAKLASEACAAHNARIAP